jgi:hypothetical protein
MLATPKVLGALLLFPLTWIAAAGVLLRLRGVPAAVATLFVAPMIGWIALRFFERWARSRAAARALSLLLFRRRAFARLHVQREAIHDELVALATELDALAARDGGTVSA